MNRDDVLHIAKKAKILGLISSGYIDQLERFAALVESHVRETEFKPDWTNYRTDDLPTQDGFPHCPYCGKDI